MFRTLDSAYVAQPASLNTCVDAFVCAFARGAVARSRSGRCPLPSRGEERERGERLCVGSPPPPPPPSFFLSFPPVGSCWKSPLGWSTHPFERIFRRAGYPLRLGRPFLRIEAPFLDALHGRGAWCARSAYTIVLFTWQPPRVFIHLVGNRFLTLGKGRGGFYDSFRYFDWFKTVPSIVALQFVISVLKLIDAVFNRTI